MDDPYDLESPDGLVLAITSGILDGDQQCACPCDCERRVEWAGELCDACAEGRHRDPLDPDDRR